MNKPKLNLQDLAPVKEAIKTAPPTEAKVSFLRRSPRHAEVREFKFVDGSRPISIVRHAVNFACPLQDRPETATLVSLKGGAKPVPLAIPYSEFKAWWSGE